MMTHFERNGENAHDPGTYKYPFDPGVELLYQFSFSPKFSLSTGINYQKGRISTYALTDDRFRYNEINFPFLFRTNFISGENYSFFISTGLFFGEMITFEGERQVCGSKWIEIPKNEYESLIKYYNQDNFFTDIILNAGFSYRINTKNEFAVSPFIKYRIADNWMGHYRKSYYYGIQLSYQLNFK